jgi:poly(A) polymerase
VKHKLSPITLDRIDHDAAKVVRRLTRYGHQAYLVGGCVRDMLLSREPKDFDVSTSATPAEIKKLFRNCRIIGRRFRLAHVFFGPKIIETSTFRAKPAAPTGDENADLMIRRDNVFGTAEEDALRRDFTINGLFYDLEKKEVLDSVGGLPDLRAGLVRTIGDANIRFQEDPIRIIRAIKFATRLDLELEDECREAMMRFRGLISRCAVARVLEESYRLLRSGHAEKSFRMMHELGTLAVLFPELSVNLSPPAHSLANEPVDAVRSGRRSSRPRGGPAGDLPAEDTASENAEAVADEEDGSLQEAKRLCELMEVLGLADEDARNAVEPQLWSHLRALDALVAAFDEPPEPPLLVATLLSALAVESLREDQRISDSSRQLQQLVRSVSTRLQLSRRHRERLEQLLGSQRRMEQRRLRTAMLNREYFADSLRLLQLRHLATGQHFDALERWYAHFYRSGRRQKRRRRRRQRRRPRPE